MDGIKAVFWDVDSTLINTIKAFGEAKRAALATMIGEGLPVTNEEDALYRLRVLEEYFNPTWYPSLLQLLCIECGVRGETDIRRLSNAGWVVFENAMTQIEPLDGAEHTIRRLKDAGIRQGVISNCLMPLQLRRLSHAGLLQHFEPDLLLISSSALPKNVLFDSFEGRFGDTSAFVEGSSLYRVEKPWQTMFREAVRRSGCLPKELLFVGDLLSDVVGANVAGFISVRYIAEGATRVEASRQILELEKPIYSISHPFELLRICGLEP